MKFTFPFTQCLLGRKLLFHGESPVIRLFHPRLDFSMYSNFSLQVSLTLKRSAIGNVVLKIKIGSLDFDRVETGVLSNGEKVVISEAQTGLISEGET